MAKSKKKAVKNVSVKRTKDKDKGPVTPVDTPKNTGKAATAAEDVPEPCRSNGSTGVIGLSNLGNTCFFNSVLQVLMASPPLQQFFAQSNYKIQQAQLSGGLQEVFQQAQSSSAPAADDTSREKPGKAKKQKLKGLYTPQRLHSAVCKYAPHFKGFQEQDSHELLRVLLEGIQAEESRDFAEPQARTQPSEQDAAVDARKEKFSQLPPQGFLSEVFAGQLSSTVTCETCRHQSTTLEPFMDLSLPIQVDTLAQLESFDRRGGKGRMGKNGMSATEGAVGAPKLGYKEKKKLAKEEKKAAKLANKGKSKASKSKSIGPADGNDTPAAAANLIPATAPTAAPSTQGTSHLPSQLDSQEADAAQSSASSTAAPHGSDTVSAAPSETPVMVWQQDNAQHAQHGSQVQAAESNHAATQQTGADMPDTQQPAEPAQSGDNAVTLQSGMPAERAEPKDVMEEVESLGKLPDMPKIDYSDDLPGLFQAAFATCDSQLSPRRAARAKPSLLGPHEQSLYEDADEALEPEEEGSNGSEGLALDASDEEEQKPTGPAKESLLDSFVNGSVEGDASSQSLQAEGDDDGCGMIGSLFDETAATGVDHATDNDGWSVDDPAGHASKEASLQSCLKGFFSQEEITWECPAEKHSKKKTRRESLNEATSGSPQSPVTPRQAPANGFARRTVSFSEAEPVVTLIPGSVEQRGKVFRTAIGEPPYCRPLRLGAAYVLLAASLDPRRPTRMHISMQPRDEEEATLMLAANDRQLAKADVPAPKIGESAEEVQLAQAQVLMDCIADLLAQKELDGMLAWCERGLKLKLGTPSSSPRHRSSDAPQHWTVVGQIPEEEGSGRWEYPLSVIESAAASPSEISLVHPHRALSETPASDPAQHPPDNSVLEPAQSLSETSVSATSQALADTPGSDPTQSPAHTPVASSPQTPSDTPMPGAAKPASTQPAPAATPAAADGTIVIVSAAKRDAAGGTSEPGSNAVASIQSVHRPTGAVLDPVASSSEDAAHEDQAGPATPSVAGETSAVTPSDQPSSSDQLNAAGSKRDEAHVSAGTESSNQEQGGSKRKGINRSVGGKPPKQSPGTPPKKGGLVNVQRPAVKGYLLHRCPPLLTIHVKRFQQDLRGRLSKLGGHLPFTLSLDLTRFCDPKGPDSAGARYTLLGFFQHMGTMRSGHYEACVQRGLSLAGSPAVQALLRKHGIDFPSNATAAQASSRPAGKPSKAAAKSRKAAGDSSNHFVATRLAAKATFAAEVSAAAADTDQSKPQSISADTVQVGAGTNGKASHVSEDWDTSDSSSVNESAVSGKMMDTGHANAPAATSEPGGKIVGSEETGLNDNTVPASVEATQTNVGSDCVSEAGHAHREAEDSLAVSQTNTNTGPPADAMPRTWYCISDSHVRAVTEADVLSREAYILLYMRVA